VRLSTSTDIHDRLCDFEDRMEMLGAAVVALADYDSSGPPTEGTMRGLAATLEELKEEINSIANTKIEEENAAYDREHPELAKLIARVRKTRAPAQPGGAR
jgi:hypothetical protein